jgi:hypothetical protein
VERAAQPHPARERANGRPREDLARAPPIGAGLYDGLYDWSRHLVDAKAFADMIRGHWGIENQRHGCLDVGFREDESRIRTDHGPENLALLRKIAMNLAKSERTHKKGIQAKRKLAAWSDTYLLKLLQAGLPTDQAK